MCGRYAIENLNKEALNELRKIVGSVPDIKPRYNIAPQQTAPVIRVLDGKPQLEELRWGFRPAWLKEKNKAQINARAEGVFESRMFKPSALKRRCLVVASGWYEWQKQADRKQPYYFYRTSKDLLTFAGIWTCWYDENDKEENSYAIITTEANKLASPVHNRMPVILEEASYSEWLDPENQDQASLQKLLKPYKAKGLSTHAVSTYVNAPKNTGAQCIEQFRIPV